MRLHEWVDSNGKKVSMNSSSAASTPASTTSGGYKKRFEKLIKYHIDHASSELESITHKDIKDNGFHLGEHYNTGSSEFDREIKVSYSIKNNIFIFSIRIDNILVENNTVDSYEKLVERLESYMFLPDAGTLEHDDLLTEWVDKSGKKVNPSSTSSQPAGTSSTNNYPSQKENYERLLKQIDADRVFRNYTVNHISDRLLELTAGNGVEVDIIYKPYVPCYIVNVSGSEATCNSWKEVLKHLIIEGIIGDTDLCESASSIVEDFRAYENLWN
jgi:hypothetical protein